MNRDAPGKGRGIGEPRTPQRPSPSATPIPPPALQNAVLFFAKRVSGLGIRGSCFAIRVSGLEFRGSVFGFRVSGLEFRVSGIEFWVRDSGFGFWISELAFGGLGLRFQVPGFGSLYLSKDWAARRKALGVESGASHTHTRSLSLSHTYTHSLTLTHTHTLSLSHTHTLARSLSLTHAHTHTHKHTHTLGHIQDIAAHPLFMTNYSLMWAVRM